MDHLDDVTADGAGVGLGLIAQQFHDLGGKNGSFDGLSHGVGGQEEALIEQTVLTQGTAALAADAGDGEPLGSAFHQVAASGNVAAGGSKTAAGILDEGTDHQVSPHVGGLQSLHELAVAVVDQDGDVGVGRFDHTAHFTDLLDGEGGAGGVALGALNEDGLHPGIGHGLCHALQVGLVVHQINLAVLHTVVLQAALALVHHADDTQ